MKSTLFASTLAAALTATSFGQVEVENLGFCCIPWNTSFDGTTLFFQPAFNSCEAKLTVWDIVVTEETPVTYEVTRLCDQPRVTDSDLLPSEEFATIEQDWYDQGSPFTWSGTFTLEPGIYEGLRFFEFYGTLIFGTACGVGNDNDKDGVCNDQDLCPDDPNKTDPGFCGCGVVDTNVNGDVDCDGDFDEDDALAAVKLFGLDNDDCPADVDGDGSIGFSDVLIILNDWGACP